MDGIDDAPASEDFMVIFAAVFVGKNALPLATEALLCAARPVRATETPRPAPATDRLVIDITRETDIVDVQCVGGMDVVTGKPKPWKKNPSG